MDFYSARLLIICLVADGSGRKRNLFDNSVIVFRAKNAEDAFKRALQLGRKREHDYKNSKGQLVRWVLVDILNVDRIGRTLDGKEVASSLHYRTNRRKISPSRIFHPENSKPTESF
jgi:hypothetical protein